MSLCFFLIAYNTALSSSVNKYAPVIAEFSTGKSAINLWLSSALRAFHHAEDLGNTLALLLIDSLLSLSLYPLP